MYGDARVAGYRSPLASGALAERGLRVPGDIGVVGFGGLPESRWTAPPLTTVRRPVSEMAATALRLLVRMMDGDRPESTRTELSTRLVGRSSTARPSVSSQEASADEGSGPIV